MTAARWRKDGPTHLHTCARTRTHAATRVTIGLDGSSRHHAVAAAAAAARSKHTGCTQTPVALRLTSISSPTSSSPSNHLHQQASKNPMTSLRTARCVNGPAVCRGMGGGNIGNKPHTVRTTSRWTNETFRPSVVQWATPNAIPSLITTKHNNGKTVKQNLHVFLSVTKWNHLGAVSSK